MVNHLIDEEKLNYAVPVYDFNKVKTIPDNEIQFTISDELFLEMLLLKIRGETIKYCTEKKKKLIKKENELISDIKIIEESDTLLHISDLLNDKKSELQEIRNVKLQGHIIRSRMQQLSENEKPTKYFCSLETKNYIEKTIKRVKLSNGKTITSQSAILSNVKEFYQSLYENKDYLLNDQDVTKIAMKISNLINYLILNHKS